MNPARSMTLARWLVLVLATSSIACSPSPGATDRSADLVEEFGAIIRARKTAAAQGDSVGWLKAASLDPKAICVDASGAVRRCRPDFGAPGVWQLRWSIDSLQVTGTGPLVVVAYRETDTVLVGTETAHNSFRYVETYRRADRGWELVAFTETPIVPPRVAAAEEVARHPLLVGSYTSGQYRLIVTAAPGHLTIAEPGAKSDTMFALATGRFFVLGDHGEYEFVQSGRAPATELLYWTGGQALRFRRAP